MEEERTRTRRGRASERAAAEKEKQALELLSTGLSSERALVATSAAGRMWFPSFLPSNVRTHVDRYRAGGTI